MMEYRQLPHGEKNEKFSVLGLGMGGIQRAPDEEIEHTVRRAIVNGVNYFDLCGGAANVYAPFGRAMTRNQCIQYALDCPGVLTVVPGVRGLDDLNELLTFPDAAQEERDYSFIRELTPKDIEGHCVYCSHCHPCPAGIDIGLVNKYYDLARAGDELAKNHYRKLGTKASACRDCGHCDRRCPFQVEQSRRMREIAEYFGE